MSEESDLPDWPHLGAVMKGKKVPQKTTKQWKKAKYNQCMACNWWCKLSPRYSAARWHVCPLLSVKLAWKLVKFPSTSVSHLFIGQCHHPFSVCGISVYYDDYNCFILFRRYRTFVSEDAGPNTLVATVLAKDPDGDGITYKISTGNEEGNFVIDNQKGQTCWF